MHGRGQEASCDQRQVSGRVALVTAAGAGIGAATARQFAAEGAKVLVTDVDGARAASVAKEIDESGGLATPYRLDVADGAQWTEVAAHVAALHGSLDVLHSNAARVIVKPAEELSEDEWDAQLRVTLTGAWLG